MKWAGSIAGNIALLVLVLGAAFLAPVVVGMQVGGSPQRVAVCTSLASLAVSAIFAWFGRDP